MPNYMGLIPVRYFARIRGAPEFPSLAAGCCVLPGGICLSLSAVQPVAWAVSPFTARL